MKGMTAVLVVVVAVYALLVALLWARQESMLFLPSIPSRELVATPAALGLEYETVALETADGETLHGWFVPSPRERAVLLFFHGNAGNISHRLDSLRIFHTLGLSVLMIDYRGYGRSTGRPSEQGTYEDALAAWRHLVDGRGIEPGRIILFGRSMGGAVATWLAAQHPPGALIIESVFRSVPDLAGEIYPFLPVRLLARIDYPVEELLGAVDAPVLIVHSRDDEIIPFSHGEALHAAAGQQGGLLVLAGDHNTGFLLDEARYRAGLDAFLAGLGLPAPR